MRLLPALSRPLPCLILLVASAAFAQDAEPVPPHQSWLKVYSNDQLGIAARVTALLRQHSVNVEELETRIESAPFAGTPLFVLEGVVTLPQGTSARRMREELEALGEQIGCDIDLDPI